MLRNTASSHEFTATNGEGQLLSNTSTTRVDMSRQNSYDKAFAELNEALLALRHLIVVLKRFRIISPGAVQPLFKALRTKYFYAHMNGQVRGGTPLYMPKKKSTDET